MPDDLPLEVDCQTVRGWLAEADSTTLLVDCREPDEHALVHIAEAQLVPIKTRLAELEPYRDARIAVHCHHGGRSLRVARWLREQGFALAQSMAGGIDRWSLEIDPTLPRY